MKTIAELTTELERLQRAFHTLQESYANLEVQLGFQKAENDQLRALLGHRKAEKARDRVRMAQLHDKREVTLDPETYGAFVRSGRAGFRPSLEQVDHDPEGRGAGEAS